MNTKLILRWLRFEIHAAKRCLLILAHRTTERRLFHDIAYVPGPTCIQYTAEPIPHNAHWDAVKAAYKAANSPMAEACQRTVEAVAEVLEGPKAANVTRLRSKERSK